MFGKIIWDWLKGMKNDKEVDRVSVELRGIQEKLVDLEITINKKRDPADCELVQKKCMIGYDNLRKDIIALSRELSKLKEQLNTIINRSGILDNEIKHIAESSEQSLNLIMGIIQSLPEKK